MFSSLKAQVPMARVMLRVVVASALALVLIGTSAAMAAGQPEGTADGNPEPGMMFWRMEIEKEAAPLNVHFTVEADLREANASAQPYDRRFVRPPAQAPKTADQIVAEVRAWFPDSDVQADGDDPKTFHIVDKTLQNVSKGADPLDQRMSVKLDGTLDDLLGKLPVGTIEEQALTIGAIIGKLPLPYPISVDAANKSCREILSNCFVSKQMAAVLWEADIKTKGQNTVAYMTFYGGSRAALGSANRKPLLHDIRAANGATTQPVATADTATPGMVPWLDVFQPLAYKLGIYVSIENDRRDPTVTSSVFDRRYVVPPAMPPATANDLLQLVASWFPTADITIAPENPNLAHLCESSLRDAGKGVNPMDANVSFKSEDRCGKLLQELSRLSQGAIVLDASTSTRLTAEAAALPVRKVDLVNQPYRRFVDEAVPSSSLQRVMWEADIFNVGGKPGAAIQVNGPEKSLIPLTRSDAQNTRLATRPVTTRAASQMPPRPVLPAGQPAGTRDGNPGPGMLFWRDVVEPLARTRKMYFYIENDERDAAGVSLPFDSRYVIPPVNNPKTTTQFLLMINESWFPGTTTSTDDTHPNVYCIQRNWLPAEDRSGDPLEDRCTLRFDGPMKDLMDQLAVTTHGAIALDLKSAGQIDAFNSGKPVHVLVLDQKYREVFFQAVPHSENERFLWQADIQLIKGKPTATIKFFSGLAAAATQSAAPTH